MFAMRLFGLIAYTALGAGIGAALWFGHFVNLNPAVCIIGGAVVGFLVGVGAWVRAERAR